MWLTLPLVPTFSTEVPRYLIRLLFLYQAKIAFENNVVVNSLDNFPSYISTESTLYETSVGSKSSFIVAT